ncbi:MAG: tRNA uridine-5-carboxymethylaminomethyl(34) synthesis GTPase MnmE [Deltaproteobacteria bacterium RIFOXYD12_FULL_57_12]|nr:MAG: tRNA uridine-5-carboxymethylaminomethyl(34) synthesis GTPase MnmE [Deltaproteobacteria bacterium RIFOXYD12_FULL_57_12]
MSAATHHTATTDPGEDTIAAIATPPGAGGIGIVRISGPLAAAILTRLFRPRHPRKTLASHRLYYGWIADPSSGLPLDEVLAVHMHAPHTYTREDVVEIHCHGSYLVLQKILGLVLAEGARPAQAGEFTKRAFLNGRIDLTRAEAVLELLEARTTAALHLATAQLQGRLFQEVSEIRAALLTVRAILEVAIDFPEDDVEILDATALREKLASEVRVPLAGLLAGADRGKILRQGVAAVILGRPNVGKSSLLNTLLREERALVTPVPGTTRDTIEEYIDIKGMPVRIVDTAGIRETRETVEEMGIKRARAKLAEADLVLLLLDASEPLTAEDRQLYASIREQNPATPLLLVLNKMDIAAGLDITSYASAFGAEKLVCISARSGEGIDTLEDAIFELVTGRSDLQEPAVACAPNLRHQAALGKALTACLQAEEGFLHGLPADLVAVDLQAILDHLADIIGETTTDDILDLIFSQFCIGK